MKYYVRLFIAGVLTIAFYGTPSNCKSQSPDDYLKFIDKESIRDKLYTLAADSMEGRSAGKEGQRKAAVFIADYFESIGLDPSANTNQGNPFHQYFDMKKISSELQILDDGKTIVGHYVPKIFCSSGNAQLYAAKKLKLEFAGYASDNEINALGDSVESVYLLAENLNDAYKKIQKVIATENHIRIFAISFITNSKAYDRLISGTRKLAYYLPEHKFNENYHPADSLFNFLQNDSSGIGVVFLRKSDAKNLFDTSPDKLAKVARKNSSGKKDFIKQEPKTFFFNIRHLGEAKSFQTENVAAYIAGKDNNPETVIITAHYDHLGIRDNMIYNGADDNASGTVAMMQIATAFSKMKADGIVPRRNILFLPVTAEELGLYGSSFYTASPLFPLDKTSIVLNMDMIGRTDKAHKGHPNYAYMMSMKTKGLGIKAVAKEINRKFPDFKLDYSPGPFRSLLWRFGSDHYPFIKKDVPAVSFFTGMHKDYHKPTDTPEKINYENLTTIAQIVYLIAWEMANTEE